MRRTRLVLGDKQTMDLLVAIAWAIDSYGSDSGDDELEREEASQVKAWRALQQKIRSARHEALRHG